MQFCRAAFTTMIMAALVIAAAGLAAAAPVPGLHIARGLWWDQLRLHEAAALAGGFRFDASWDVYGSPHGYNGCGLPLEDFPVTAAQFNRFNVIAITGIGAGAFPKSSLVQLKDWVEGGGGLLLFGGYHGFGSGSWQGTPLEALLPVSIAKPYDMTPCAKPAFLTPTDDGKALFGPNVPWQLSPRVYWLHAELTNKPGATVLVEADGKPVLLIWNVGKGRVAAFSGTVCGVPGRDELPFWSWEGWPQIVARLMSSMLSASTNVASDAAASAAADPEYKNKRAQLRKLGALDIESVLSATDDASASSVKSGAASFAGVSNLLALASSCRDCDFALDVIRAVVDSGMRLNVSESEALYALIAPYVQGEAFVKSALALMQSGRPGDVALALRVLGATGSPECVKLLPPFIAEGLDALPRDDKSSLMRHPDGDDERLRLCAVRASTEAALPALLEPFRAASIRWRNMPRMGSFQELQTDLEEEIQCALCVMGDGEAAVALVRTVIRNRFEAEYRLNITQQPLYEPTPKKLQVRAAAARAIPILRTRNARLMGFLDRFPSAGVVALARTAWGPEWDNEFAEEALQTCLARVGGEKPPAEVRAALGRLAETWGGRSVRLLCRKRAGL